MIAIELVLTVSRPFFVAGGDPAAEALNPERLRLFQKVAFAFAKEHFGRRIVAAVLHVDELTPHLHIVLVPLMPPSKPSGAMRLSARDLFSPATLCELQDAWELKLAPYGVGPRIKRSKLHHIDAFTFAGAAEMAKSADLNDGRAAADVPKQLATETLQSFTVRVSDWAENLRQESTFQRLLFSKDHRRNIELIRRLRAVRAALTAKDDHVATLMRDLLALRPPTAEGVAAVLGTEPPASDLCAVAFIEQRFGLNRHQAVELIATHLGPDAAANAWREVTRVALARIDWSTRRRRLSEAFDLPQEGAAPRTRNHG